MVPVSTRTLIAAGLVLGGFLVAWHWQANKYESILSAQQTEYAEASAEAIKEALAEQKRQLDAMEQVSDEGEQVIEEVAAADSAADPSVDRLRSELDTLRANTRRELSSAATQRATDRQAIMVLTELYQRADERARSLGAAFEGARARGLTCEAAYAARCQ